MVANSVELGNDEVYYFTYAVQPDWSHFDHPPLIGLFIRLFTLNLHWLTGFSLRLPALAAAAVNSWLIAHCGQLLWNQRTGLLAAILYNTSLYTSIISGLFIIPDSIQLVFWLAALHAMLKILASPKPELQKQQFLWLGLFIGLAVMCKVHGVFLWLGFLGYIVFNQRNLLRTPYLYLSLGLTLLIVSPIAVWNFDNQFISWQFHSQRVETNKGVDPRAFVVTTLGQIAYNNPANVLIALLALFGLVKRSDLKASRSTKVLLWCSLPIILATSFVSLFRTTLPHWSGPGFLGLTLISASYLDFRLSNDPSDGLSSGLIRMSIVVIVSVVILGVLLVNFYPGSLNQKSKSETGSGDFTLDMYGWNALSSLFEKMRMEDIRTGRMTSQAPLLTTKWFPGGHLYYYVAYPLKMRMIGVGPIHDLHKFHWLNSQNGSTTPGTGAYFIVPSNYFSDPSIQFGSVFGNIGKPRRITQKRNGRVARYFYVYRLTNALKPADDT